MSITNGNNMVWYNATPLTTDKSMKTKINQWFMVKDELFSTDENAMRYLEMLHYNVHHDTLQLYQNRVCKNGKATDIMTIVTDDKKVYDEFCAMADKVNGLYCVYDIMDNASKVLEKL